MLRLALVPLLALAACTPAPAPDEALALAREAVEAGDARNATRLLRVAADAGHLSAIATLALGYQQGSYRQPTASAGGPGSGARLLATRRSAWEARRWTDRYLRLVRRPSDDPTALRMQALDLLNGRPDAGEPLAVYAPTSMGRIEGTDAQRDSAFAILDRLADGGDAEAAYALAWMHRKAPGAARRFQRAVALGSGPACVWQAFRAQGPTAAETAAYFEAYEACAAMPGGAPPAGEASPRERTHATLRREVARGNEAARALLDSLVVIGALPDA